MRNQRTEAAQRASATEIINRSNQTRAGEENKSERPKVGEVDFVRVYSFRHSWCSKLTTEYIDIDLVLDKMRRENTNKNLPLILLFVFCKP